MKIFILDYNIDFIFFLIAFMLSIILFFSLKKRNKTMTYDIVSLQNIGARESQDDSFIVKNKPNENEMIAVVSDGMGGLRNGKIASQITVNSILNKYIQVNSLKPQQFLKESIKQCELDVEKYIQESSIQCGATLVSVLLKNNHLYFSSVGDSCIFLVRENTVLRLNHFHNYASILSERVKRGEITNEEAKNNPLRYRLTSYIGVGDGIKSEICQRPINIKNSEVIMLCTDGVYNALGDDLILELLKSKPFDMVAKNIEKAILDQKIKNQDNFTAVIILCKESKK